MVGWAAFCLFFALPALVFAGPINNPGSAPFTKLGVYQGVIGIVPATGSVMEIGNVVTSPANGSEIAATGDIYIRPQAGAITAPGNYARFTHAGGGKTGLYVPGPLCLNGQCLDTWANICNFITCGGGPGGGTLDQVLEAGNSSDRTILLNFQPANARSLTTTAQADASGAGTGQSLFFVPNLGNGGYNNLSLTGDAGIFYSDIGGLVLGPWAGSSEGLRIAPNGNVGIGTNQHEGRLTVQQDNTGGNDRANQFVIRGQTNTNLKLNLGIHTETGLDGAPFGEIGFLEEGVAWRNLVLTKNGGSVGVGGVTNPSAKLVVSNNLAGTGSSTDAVAIFANTGTSALYSQQNNPAGYAGYFSSGVGGSNQATIHAENLLGPANGVAEANALEIIGDIEVIQKGQTPSVWPNGSMVKIWGNVSRDNPSPDDGYLLDVRNADALGLASRFQGESLFFAQDAVSNRQSGGLTAYGGNTPNSTATSWAIRAEGGGGSGRTYGGYFSALNTGAGSYAIYATASGGSSWAGYFQGRVEVNGPISATDGSKFEGVTSFEGIVQYKRFGSPTSGFLVANVGAQSGVSCQTSCSTAGLGCFIGKNLTTLALIACTDAAAATKMCLCL